MEFKMTADGMVTVSRNGATVGWLNHKRANGWWLSLPASHGRQSAPGWVRKSQYFATLAEATGTIEQCPEAFGL
jgi:hypothetical protein